MVILVNKDILVSFCMALDAQWEAVDESSAIFFLAGGPPDFVYCRRDGDNVSVELGQEAAVTLVRKVEAEIERRSGRKMEDWEAFELAALLLLVRMLKK